MCAPGEPHEADPGDPLHLLVCVCRCGSGPPGSVPVASEPAQQVREADAQGLEAGGVPGVQGVGEKRSLVKGGVAQVGEALPGAPVRARRPEAGPTGRPRRGRAGRCRGSAARAGSSSDRPDAHRVHLAAAPAGTLGQKPGVRSERARSRARDSPSRMISSRKRGNLAPTCASGGQSGRLPGARQAGRGPRSRPWRARRAPGRSPGSREVAVPALAHRAPASSITDAIASAADASSGCGKARVQGSFASRAAIS